MLKARSVIAVSSMDTAKFSISLSIKCVSLFTFRYALVNTRDSISKTLYTILKGLGLNQINQRTKVNFDYDVRSLTKC